MWLVIMEYGLCDSTIHYGWQGMEALEGQSLSDVVMLNMHLPGISGEDIYAMTKERGEGRRVLLYSVDL